MRIASLAVFLLLAVPVAASVQPVTLTPDQGPDVPGAVHVATVPALVDNHHTFGRARHTATVDAPDADWNRVILTLHSYPDPVTGDPWDRVFMVFIEGTEVLHGTTTRGDMVMTEDITEYASLMGGSFDVSTQIDIWQGSGIFMDVTLDFYNDPVVPEQPAARVVSALSAVGLREAAVTRTVDVGSPSSAVLEVFTSGHEGCGEFWYLLCEDAPWDPPHFRIDADGQTIATFDAPPYVYALLGFCCGTTSQVINHAMWYPAFAAGEATGVHFVTGEIPAYRAELTPEIVALLQGEVDITIQKENHDGWWPTSVNLLLD